MRAACGSWRFGVLLVHANRAVASLPTGGMVWCPRRAGALTKYESLVQLNWADGLAPNSGVGLAMEVQAV